MGGLGSVGADALGAVVIRAALARAGVEAGEVSDVILGQVLTAGQGQNPARQAAIKAGLPQETPAITINQVCGSGPAGGGLGLPGDRRRATPSIVVAGGQESMSLATHCALSARRAKMGSVELSTR